MGKDSGYYYRKYFGEITLQDLEDILNNKKIPNDEKIICAKGWLKIYREQQKRETK